MHHEVVHYQTELEREAHLLDTESCVFRLKRPNTMLDGPALAKAMRILPWAKRAKEKHVEELSN